MQQLWQYATDWPHLITHAYPSQVALQQQAQQTALGCLMRCTGINGTKRLDRPTPSHLPHTPCRSVFCQCCMTQATPEHAGGAVLGSIGCAASAAQATAADTATAGSCGSLSLPLLLPGAPHSGCSTGERTSASTSSGLTGTASDSTWIHTQRTSQDV